MPKRFKIAESKYSYLIDNKIIRLSTAHNYLKTGKEPKPITEIFRLKNELEKAKENATAKIAKLESENLALRDKLIELILK